MKDLRLGVDVGGTNTDAVVVDEAGGIVAETKTATTPEPIDGIVAAMTTVIDQLDDATRLGKAMLGTTHPTNAIIRRRDLDRVGVLRLAAPSSLGVRPSANWPEDLRDIVIGRSEITEGGFEYDGSPIAELDEDAIRRFANSCAGDVSAIAVSCAFSPACTDHELRAAELIAQECGDDMAVSLSHTVGSLGLLERENATILNASLLTVARRVVNGFRDTLMGLGLEVESFLTQNDGTLMTVEEADRYPVLTVGSGPTNSMRGACALAGLSDALVIDVGGTSADIGILINGFPRESTAAVEVGGVRTNFRMPDLISVGLGGGTIVRQDVESVAVGPDSVGYRVIDDALCMGGATLTLSDVSLAVGRLTGFGDPALLSDVDDSVCESAIAWVDEKVQVLCERMKASSTPLPLMAVGGGAHLVPAQLAGISEVVWPPHHSVANAFGAAIAEAAGSIDRVYSYDASSREDCLRSATEEATDAAIRAGANASDVRITSVVEIPMTYVPGGGCRVIVKAVGPLAA
ncbi:hydantoinase/oxoprolinase N-terminal domain-containing protein [Candidatus Poriferisodalis sp.]|uniref:hydantoinase/oxoprolinase N-terminal domain-containing protein n=1 Tax=Candidatus Poriferisodalis sp. TaxID=3101277 RepID=UPI003B01B12C